MKKKLLIIFFLITLVLGIIIIMGITGIIFNWRSNTMKFELHDNYIVDTMGLRERLRMTENSPLIFFEQIKILDGAEEHILKEHRLKINDLNLDCNKFLIITIGRQIEGIEYERISGRRFARANIILSIEHYENMMYIYITDKILLADSFGDEISFYVMDGTERVFLGNGIFSINELALRNIPISSYTD